MTEYAPGWSTPRMTKAQMRKYLSDAKAVREAAIKKLPNDQQLAKEQEKEIKKIEDKLDEVF